MANVLFQSTVSPTNTTKPSKAVNETPTSVRLTHNTFDNSYFNFKTQRYGLLEPFFWKNCVAGDNEPFSNSHNVRSLPFSSPILSPMKLNKDYFQVPMYAIQPNTWDYIFKNPSQGDDVPSDAQNLFPLFQSGTRNIFKYLVDFILEISNYMKSAQSTTVLNKYIYRLFMLEQFFSSGSLLFQLGYKNNPVFVSPAGSTTNYKNTYYSFDQLFDLFLNSVDISISLRLDSADGFNNFTFRTTSVDATAINTFKVDRFTIASLIRSYPGNISAMHVTKLPNNIFPVIESFLNIGTFVDDTDTAINSIRMDTINAYQLACAQYYVNPRVDFLYNAQLYRDNFISMLRETYDNIKAPEYPLPLGSFDYNGIPVLYDYFSEYYYNYVFDILHSSFISSTPSDQELSSVYSLINYLFGLREQLRFGNYFTDSRTQALGYGDPGSDVIQVYDNGVSVTDVSQKLVLERFRGAVAHLDNSAEDYLKTMFHEDLPPDYHYPKFIAHSEFAISGDEVSNTTSDNQGNLVTNLKSGQDTAEFNIEISVPSILVGISYVSIPEIYTQIKERHYFHADRYDMFQPMLQYFGDQGIYNKELSDSLINPADAYGYTSRNGEYKQRVSQASGAFLTSLKSWIFAVDLPEFALGASTPRFAFNQSPDAIRAHDFEFNRFLARQTGYSLGTGFHFIMQYNNQNVSNRPMDVNPLPLYPNQSL